MRKVKFLICILTICLITGCGNKKEEVKENITTEASTEAVTESITTEAEEEKKEIIAQGKGGEITPTETDANPDTEEELPETMEPLDNNDKINPSFTNLSIMKSEHFNRAAILDAVLSYMYKEGISDDVCTNINIDQDNCYSGIAYKITLTFESNGKREAALIGNNNTYEIQPYINADETEFTPDN